MGMSDYYKQLREQIGNELIFMPSVTGVIRNASGEILLQNKGTGEKWSLPAGAIELGESPAKAVVREVWEETGLYVTPKKLLGIFGGEDFRYQYPNGHQVEYNIMMFECSIHSGNLEPTDKETMRLQYFDPSKMPELALPYPKALFTQTETSHPFYHWDERWLNELS